ncbi:primosomal protein N' [Ruminococcus sp. OA3]|uniref:replication restart helicase PriA n=1 Tax=Ruminococcus sp. OA3 TaxID=2914164 RepID=UPI001F06B9A5|nr:primosomal protein N' [Ruminococcus sp. OA3]MCH1982281.1 primosomal protein N' [Ruminococcus sp. OA3]
MEKTYADVIVDITSEKLDRTFQYRIPEELESSVRIGIPVLVPFGRGNRMTNAYVVGITQEAQFQEDRMKEIAAVPGRPVGVETRLIALASWMKETYGATMIQALKTVLPMKQEVRTKQKRTICLLQKREEAQEFLRECEKKHRTARARVMKALLEQGELDYAQALRELNVTSAVLGPLLELGIISVDSETLYRSPNLPEFDEEPEPVLSEEQKHAARQICEEMNSDSPRPCLVYGITGSGKTRLYMEIIDRVLRGGRQVIVLIPEIALTYQIAARFRRRFRGKAAVIHSRMSQGERWDAFEQARNGQVQVMVGPRSALFTPFPQLGLIIIDEEHETSYKSEGTPRYHARETAVMRATLEDAAVVMGSATPSLEAYYRCQSGEYRLLTLTQRFGSGMLPSVYTVDMREELSEGNTSIISRSLRDAIQKRLDNREQTILFLNRRGYAGFLSCRSCGHVVKCPHCDVSLSLHRGGKMVCHYCGYTEKENSACPCCGSRYIGAFRAGTQQIEDMVRRMFPQAKVLRMDMDTTRKKDSHSEILSSFAGGEADILIGTQMIVKGHDFPRVTLVGVLAADLSLNADDYRCAERTFQLLVQAVGRAGRGKSPGEAFIQTYQPEHYSIRAAVQQDYPAFYQEEIAYRMLMDYPPACAMMAVTGSGEDEEQLAVAMQYIRKYIENVNRDNRLSIIGPADATVSKIQDRYRKVLYLKHPLEAYLAAVRTRTERYMEVNAGFRKLYIQFDLNS